MANGGPTIAIECENLFNHSGTGIATYAKNLALQLCELGIDVNAVVGVRGKLSTSDAGLNEILLFDDDPSKTPTFADKLATGVQWLHASPFGVQAQDVRQQGFVHSGASRHGRSFSRILAAHRLTQRAKFHFARYGHFLTVRGLDKADLFHTTHPVPLQATGIPLVCTIHDLIPLRLPGTTMDNKRYFYGLIKELAKRCDRIVTVSEHSRRDIIQLFNVPEHKVVNTYQAVDVEGAATALSEDQLATRLESEFGVEYRKYYLFVGAIEPKKNVSRLVDAYAASASPYPLLISGKLGWQYEGDVKRMAQDRFKMYRFDGTTIRPFATVQHLNYVARESLDLLIRGARALVFPSLYEGFGLPALEAMALGTPVITSNTSSLPEVCGSAAHYVSPYDTGSIADAFRVMDRDSDLRDALSVKGREQAKLFTAERYRERLRGIYQGLT